MRIHFNEITIHIRYFSVFELRIIALDYSTGRFPDGITLDYGAGSQDLTASSDEAFAKEQVQFGFTSNVPLTARVRMFDLANSLVRDFSLRYKGETIWSHADAIHKLNTMDSMYEFAPTRIDVGERSIVFIYADGGSCARALGVINAWQPTFFEKRFNSGIAISLLPSSQLKAHYDKLSRATRRVIICEEAVLPSAVKIGAELFQKSDLIVIGSSLLTEPIGTGISDAIAKIMRFDTVSEILSPALIYNIFTCLAGYADLFFPRILATYFHAGGTPSQMVSDFVRCEVQNKIYTDIIIISPERRARLSDFDAAIDNIFVNVGVSSRIFDILDRHPHVLLRSAMARGLVVKTIKVSNK